VLCEEILYLILLHTNIYFGAFGVQLKQQRVKIMKCEFESNESKKKRNHAPLMSISELARNPDITITYSSIVKKFNKYGTVEVAMVHSRGRKYYNKADLEAWAVEIGLIKNET
jgi:hypothetical protein